MNLSGKEKRALRAEASLLKPEIWIGREGIGPGVIQNLENAFNTKEIVKVKLQENCPLTKEEVGHILSEKTGAEVVQIIGKTLVLYRPQSKGEQ